jgi:hypothetical protein
MVVFSQPHRDAVLCDFDIAAEFFNLFYEVEKFFLFLNTLASELCCAWRVEVLFLSFLDFQISIFRGVFAFMYFLKA